MQVQDLQCQIAQAQIARYLAGEPFDQESRKQLNDHIAGCPRCKTAIADRKTELQANPGSDAPPADLEAIADKKSIWRGVQPRMLAYAGGLALVLGAMSYLANDPTALFGEKASSKLLPPTATAPRPTKADPNLTAKSTPPASEEKPLRIAVNNLTPGKLKAPAGLNGPMGTIDKTGKPAMTVYPPSSAIAKAVSSKGVKTAAIHTVRRRRSIAMRPKQNSPRPEVVIYDSKGKPIKNKGNKK